MESIATNGLGKTPEWGDLLEVHRAYEVEDDRRRFYHSAYRAGALAIMNKVGYYRIGQPLETKVFDLLGGYKVIAEHHQSEPIRLKDISGRSESGSSSTYVVGRVADTHHGRFLSRSSVPHHWDTEEFYLRELTEGEADYSPLITRGPGGRGKFMCHRWQLDDWDSLPDNEFLLDNDGDCWEHTQLFGSALEEFASKVPGIQLPNPNWNLGGLTLKPDRLKGAINP